jgi:transcriptional regulator with XRE-family HTH domain
MAFMFFMSTREVALEVAKKARERRLSQNLSQKSLSERSGVSLSVLKKFEHTGKISMDSLLKLAMALGSLEDFDHLFQATPPEKFPSLDALIKDTSRKRGRK